MATWGGAVMTTFGFGGGAGLIKLLNHWPAPLSENIYLGAFFDWLQDMATNKRIGDRRSRAGADIPPVPKPDPVPTPVPAAPVSSPELTRPE